jgi:hypothetical protein
MSCRSQALSQHGATVLPQTNCANKAKMGGDEWTTSLTEENFLEAGAGA